MTGNRKTHEYRSNIADNITLSSGSYREGFNEILVGSNHLNTKDNISDTEKKDIANKLTSPLLY